MTFNYLGNDMDFRDIFFLYLQGMEGYELTVYKDIYGNNTVGLGHLVKPSDNLSYGDTITDAQALQLFYDDYDTLNIEQYVKEAAQNYNQALAIAHFVWGHGDGQYKDSQLRQHVINHDIDYNGMIAYLNSNWDVNKPKNQKVNKEDFTVYYSAQPWQPSKDLSYYLSKLQNFITTSASSNPVMTYGAGAIVVLGIAAIGFGIYEKIKKK